MVRLCRVVACGFGLYARLHRRLRGWHPLLESEPIPLHVTVLRADDPDAGEVRALAVAADGSLVSGAWDATLRVWRDGACVRTLSSGYMGDVNAVAAFGASRLLSGSDDGSARLWTADGTLERAYEMGSSSAPSPCSPSRACADGEHLVVGGDQGGVRLFHVDGTLVHKRPKAHAAQVFALTATPDGAHVVSGSFDQRIKVWSVASRGLVGSCDGHTAAVWAVAALADGERLLRLRRQDGARVAARRRRREPCSRSRVAHRRRDGARAAARRPLTRSPPRSTRPSRSSASSTAPACAASRTTRARCTPSRCCPQLAPTVRFASPAAATTGRCASWRTGWSSTPPTSCRSSD